MVSIGTIKGAQADYHQRQIAQGADDYYTGHGEAPGHWAGAVARELELSGEIGAEGHAALVSGRDPQSGEELAERTARSSVLAYDVTFSAPKSASILYAVAAEVSSKPTSRPSLRASTTSSAPRASSAAATPEPTTSPPTASSPPATATA